MGTDESERVMRGQRWLAILPLVLGLNLALTALLAGELFLAMIAAGLVGAAIAIWRAGGGTMGEMARFVRWLAIVPLALGCQLLFAAAVWRAWFGLVLAGALFVVAALLWRGLGGSWSLAARTARE